MHKRGLAKSSFYKKLFHKNYDLISATYHEAGHTICGLLNFVKISSAEAKLYKDKKIGGHIYFDGFTFEEGLSPDILKILVLKEIKLSYAGITAEKYLLKMISGSNISPFFLKWGAKDDISDAANLIEKYQLAPRGKKRYKFKQKIIKEVQKELQNHWDAVIIVANMLYKHKQINYNDLKHALCTKSVNKIFWKDQFKKIDHIFNDNSKLNADAIRSIMLNER